MADEKFEWPGNAKSLSGYLRLLDKLLHEIAAKGPLGAQAAELINSGGKRLRPALTLIAADAPSGKPAPKAIQAAAAIELVHMASLVHDDLLDASPLRRGQPAAAARHQGLALLLGDYLLARALSVAAAADAAIARLIADTIAGMAEGEALELADEQPLRSLSPTYFKIIDQKTASLFAAAAAAGAICAKRPPKDVKSFQQFGRAFGTAFQLIDDLEDRKLSPDQKPAALKEINMRLLAAEASLTGVDSTGIADLKRLPFAYLDWASPL